MVSWQFASWHPKKTSVRWHVFLLSLSLTTSRMCSVTLLVPPGVAVMTVHGMSLHFNLCTSILQWTKPPLCIAQVINREIWLFRIQCVLKSSMSLWLSHGLIWGIWKKKKKWHFVSTDLGTGVCLLDLFSCVPYGTNTSVISYSILFKSLISHWPKIFFHLGTSLHMIAYLKLQQLMFGCLPGGRIFCLVLSR